MAIAKIYSVHDDTMDLNDNSTGMLIARKKVVRIYHNSGKEISRENNILPSKYKLSCKECKYI